MSQFSIAYKLLTQAEFSNKPEKFLHKNSTEKSYTLGGIYRHMNPDALNWSFVDDLLRLCNHDLERASRMLYNDEIIYKEVYDFFKRYYWTNLRLDEIQSQKIANEIFDCAVNIGQKNAIKLAQRLVGALDDGYIGSITVKCLNIYNEETFDLKFDDMQKKYYDDLIANNPELGIYQRGWYNRADLV